MFNQIQPETTLEQHSRRMNPPCWHRWTINDMIWWCIRPHWQFLCLTSQSWVPRSTCARGNPRKSQIIDHNYINPLQQMNLTKSCWQFQATIPLQPAMIPLRGVQSNKPLVSGKVWTQCLVFPAPLTTMFLNGILIFHEMDAHSKHSLTKF